jgi:hypothetical protein
MKAVNFILAFLPLFLSVAEANPSRILRPRSVDFSQISGFSAEWCTTRVRGAGDVSGLCFGTSQFQQSQSVRSIAVRRAGVNELYVEDEMRSVDLFRLEFGVLGPVHSGIGMESELGKVSIRVDGNGEVIYVHLWTPSLGQVEAFR